MHIRPGSRSNRARIQTSERRTKLGIGATMHHHYKAFYHQVSLRHELDSIPQSKSKQRRRLQKRSRSSLFLFLLLVGAEAFPTCDHRRNNVNSIHLSKSAIEKPNFLKMNALMSSKTKRKETVSESSMSFDRSKMPFFMQNTTMTDIEMVTMGATGLLFSVGVVATLAIGQVSAPFGSGGSAVGLDLIEGEAGMITTNVMAAALPGSTTDIVAVALGEGVAGLIGAGATFVINLLLRFRINPNMARMGGDVPETEGEILAEAVADGDYFLTRAAAVPLLEAAGIPIFAASLASVVLATVPYEIIKLGSRRKREIKEEDAVLDLLLKEEKLEKQKNKKFGGFSFRAGKKKAALEVASLEAAAMVIPSEAVASFDPVEFISDITKWLEYDVLKTDYAGVFMWQGQLLNPGVESAVFGFLAAFSSQLYADVLYCYTNYGKEAKRIETQTRSLSGWVNLYSTKCLNSATLFGVYEYVRVPVSKGVLAWFSGGVDSCLGSRNFELCISTYALDNPPEASQQAEFRALITTVVSLFDRLQTDDGSAGAKELIRSFAVHAYSVFVQMIPSSLDFSF